MEDQPSILFDAEKITNIIQILRSGNNATNNCTHLSSDLIRYFRTGVIPDAPSSTDPSSLKDFDAIIVTDWIEKEDGTKYLGVIKSIVCLDNTSISDIPCDIEPGGIYNVDRFTQYRAHVTEINDAIGKEAANNKNGYSFGYINIGRCGEYVEESGYMLVYFATATEIRYMDCHKYDGIKKENNGCIFLELTDVYNFANTHTIDINTFGEYVFYIPMGPSSKEISTSEEDNKVKKENLDDEYSVDLFTLGDDADQKKSKQSKPKQKKPKQKKPKQAKPEKSKPKQKKSKCVHKKEKTTCVKCHGSAICEHSRRTYRCKDCKGVGICEHGKEKYVCKTCKGGGVCEHDKQKAHCIKCKGSQICKHDREKRTCKECHGKGLCEHDRRKSVCNECNPSLFCEHNRKKSVCRNCKLPSKRKLEEDSDSDAQIINNDISDEVMPIPFKKRKLIRIVK